MSAFLWWIFIILLAWFCFMFISLKEDTFSQNCFSFSVSCNSSLFLVFKPSLSLELNALQNCDGCFVAFVDWIILKLHNETFCFAPFLEILIFSLNQCIQEEVQFCFMWKWKYFFLYLSRYMNISVYKITTNVC